MFNQNTPASNSQNYVLPTIHRAIHALIRALIRAGLSASLCLWPSPPPAQAGASERGGAQNLQESSSLELGKAIERELSGGMSHFYKITIASGQFMHVVVKQQGIDVAVALSTPDGKKIAEVDIERMGEGSETASAVSESAGAYLIEVRSSEKIAKPGRYEIKIEELRIATAEDRYRVAGDAIFREAVQLVDGTLEAKKKAVEKYHEALDLYRRAGYHYGEAIAINNAGLVHWSLGDMRKALDKFSEALPIFKAIGDRREEATTLSNIGLVYQSLGEMQKALEKYNEALPLKRAAGDRRGEAITLSNIGLVYQSLGDAQKALEKFNAALPLRRAVGDRDGEAATLLGIARVEQKCGNLIQARQTVEQAVGMIELLRTNTTSQELRASYLASRRDFYQSYIDILMEMQKQNPGATFDAVAFAVSERARARSLLELLIESRADIRQGVDSSLLERERSLRQRLNAKAAAQVSLLSRKHTPEQVEASAKDIASITTEYEELKAQIRASSPRYAALTQPQPLNLVEIQAQALDPDTLLLEYSLGDNASYLFVVSQTSITSYQLPKRAEIEAATRRVHGLLTAPQPRPGENEAIRQARIKEARANYWPQAAVLSRMLLGPAASQLGAKRLLIVADGALQYLPFGALPAPEMERRGNEGGRKQSGEGAGKPHNPQSRNPQSADS